jgi:hypothetical protein
MASPLTTHRRHKCRRPTAQKDQPDRQYGNVHHGSAPNGYARKSLFMVGQDKRGNWVVQDQKGMCGGLFISREAALRYVRSENGFQPRAVVMVSGGFELDMNRNVGGVLRPENASDLASRRRIA